VDVPLQLSSIAKLPGVIANIHELETHAVKSRRRNAMMGPHTI